MELSENMNKLIKNFYELAYRQGWKDAMLYKKTHLIKCKCGCAMESSLGYNFCPKCGKAVKKK